MWDLDEVRALLWRMMMKKRREEAGRSLLKLQRATEIGREHSDLGLQMPIQGLGSY
jgi:hypothetical protein